MLRKSQFFFLLFESYILSFIIESLASIICTYMAWELALRASLKQFGSLVVVAAAAAMGAAVEAERTVEV